MSEKEKELKAFNHCADALNNLENKSIMKVFQMLSIHFEIVNEVAVSFPEKNSFNSELKSLDFGTSEKDVYNNSINTEMNNSDYPSLKEILLKDFPKNEAEWVLCYSYYASNFGEDSFTIDQLKEKYRENNRYSTSNQKNFSTNLGKCIKNDWLKHISGDEYFVKDEGKKYVNQILEGNSTTTERRRGVKKKTKANLEG